MLSPYPRLTVNRSRWMLSVVLALLMLLAFGWLIRPRPTLLDGPVPLPLRFVPNHGQTDPSATFQAHTPAGQLFFTATGPILAFDPLTDPAQVAVRPTQPVQLHFEQANPAPNIRGGARQPGRVNYFLGNDPARWRTGLPTYAALTYHDLYPGIDLRYDGLSGAGRRGYLLKGTFTVAPGADPGQIRWRYRGAEGVRLDSGGNLIISLPAAEIVEQAPVAWQIHQGQQIPVPVRYTLSAGSIGFSLPQGYDPARPLIIDPILSYSTYLGGSTFDYGEKIVVDDAGNSYITGYTRSTDFPTANPAQADNGGAWDAFIVKLNPDGSELVYATYLGGAGNDSGFGIAVDDQGQVTVTGDTSSPDFPLQNPIQSSTPGNQFDAFIAKLSADGSQLRYATYLGGSGDERGYDVALDGAGNATVVGYTRSTDFPTLRAIQPGPNFGQGLNEPPDAFVTSVISRSGVYTWGYSTYLGGVDWDEALGLAVASDGQTTITGRTQSADFPLAQPAQATLGGGSDSFDAFVTRIITASGRYTFAYSTYLGGEASESGRAVALAADGAAYIVGDTTSRQFPTRDPLQFTYGGGQDAFVTSVISQSGVYTWGYSTYLGGGGEERGQALALGGDGSIYVVGYSRSPDLPVTGDTYDGTCGTIDGCTGSGDAFLAKIEANDLVYATYLGGRMTDIPLGLGLDSAGNVYLGGSTQSPDFPTTTGAYDTACNDGTVCGPSGSDAFLAKFDFDPPLALRKQATPADGSSLFTGSMIDYTLTISARTTLSATVTLSDTLPAEIKLLTGTLTSTVGSPTATGSQISLTLPGLTVGQGVTLTFRAEVITAPATVVNRAVLQTGSEIFDSNRVYHRALEPGDSLVYLPIIYKNYSPPVAPTPTPTSPPPPPTSTPAACAPSILTTVNVGSEPQGIAIDEDRRRVYIANRAGNSVSVIDSGSNSLLTTITGLTAPTALALDPQRNILWVTLDDSVIPVQANPDSTFTLLNGVTVGQGAADVVYDPLHDALYVANRDGNSVSIIDAGSRTLKTTLSGSFNQPVRLAVNPITGKVYVVNFGSNSLTVINDTTVARSVSLFDSSQPYGVAVDELRNLVYVSSVDSHRIVAINGVDDSFLGWAAFQRGSNPNNPVPLRALAINPDLGPFDDGGHLWSLTATEDGSERDQVLLIPKGWASYFSLPVPYTTNLRPTGDLAIDRTTDRVYITNGLAAGTVTILQDRNEACLVPFATDEAITLEIFVRE